ncbi:hypothetical protein MRX96_039890 [Rhipicephalus microplus]
MDGPPHGFPAPVTTGNPTPAHHNATHRSRHRVTTVNPTPVKHAIDCVETAGHVFQWPLFYVFHLSLNLSMEGAGAYA